MTQHLSVDATGIKVYGKREGKVLLKLLVAVVTSTIEIIAAEQSLSNVTRAEVLPNLR
ncbi:TPA: hypothetical protein N2903_004452 [Vibrio parahaemolyticus]|nr:hypothetical protein [Vibrio parahaemolyticus]HAS6334013.1 hypothetical protein [Vibrio vulnificus]EHZ2723048.1 hypothetical protein [Vibrio parahaemolyticus]EIO4604155.1 hypothetical protein [Vibrio parahaemolyticus]EIV1595777.1 hypothetical protein [Vibrio parahaemolyticus]EJG2371849.1 hypothetical protein [Vibrio parahaemolyticus]